MLERIAIGLMLMAGFLFICWMLTRYWLYTIRQAEVNELTGLSVWNRLVFGFENFCKAVNGKKSIRQEKVGESCSAVSLDKEIKSQRTIEIQEITAGKEREAMHRERKYKMKENM